MHKNISKMQAQHGLKSYNFVPKTFILPIETVLLNEDYEKTRGRVWYIVKPHASSQGKGIFITDHLSDVRITEKSNSPLIVSHYIGDPYLINGLKFDLRIYVALTSVHPLRIYMYEEGLVRFATAPYSTDPSSKSNSYIHLTNYSINKKSENYIQNDGDDQDEDCSKWSLRTFRAYLDNHGANSKEVFNKIEDLVIKTILSIESTLFTTTTAQVPFPHNCFDLFGFDILLDSKLKPWLLEVNLSPSLACDSPLDLKIKSGLISDLFTMIGIVPIHQRTHNESQQFGKSYTIYNHPQGIVPFERKNKVIEMKSLDELTKEEKAVIQATNDEWERRGKFRRIFPSEKVNDYNCYFEADRPYNRLLRNIINTNLKKNNENKIKTVTLRHIK